MDPAYVSISNRSSLDVHQQMNGKDNQCSVVEYTWRGNRKGDALERERTTRGIRRIRGLRKGTKRPTDLCKCEASLVPGQPGYS